MLRLFFYLYYVLFYPYDLLHAFTVAQPQIGLPALMGKWGRREKLIVDWDDLWGGGFADYHPFPVRQVLGFFERFVPRFADKVTVVSEDLRQRTLALGIAPDRVFKIPNGANIEEVRPLEKRESRQRLELQENGRYLVSIGNTYYSSLPFLLTAFRRVVQKEPTAQLLLVGLVEIPADCRGVYEDVRENTVVVGSKPFKEMPDYLAAADVLILPMGPEPIEVARYPIRLGDYLAAGRPIVANAVGEVKLVLEGYRCGLTSPVGEPPALAENILRIFADEKLAEELGQRALATAHQLSWEKVTGQLAQVYAGS
jgi:glycosyltransferase involved in cell wall biosynthesis